MKEIVSLINSGSCNTHWWQKVNRGFCVNGTEIFCQHKLHYRAKHWRGTHVAEIWNFYFLHIPSMLFMWHFYKFTFTYTVYVKITDLAVCCRPFWCNCL